MDLGVTGTRSTALMYLTAGADVDLNELQKQLEEATSLCMVHTVSSSSELNCLLLICHRSAQPQDLMYSKASIPIVLILDNSMAHRQKISPCSKEESKVAPRRSNA